MDEIGRKEEILETIRERYGRIAERGAQGCGCGQSCCGSPRADTPGSISGELGYSEEEIGSVPDGADMGLGCGNPQALAALREGETVLDLGCGGGLDVFLAAGRVGASGEVIGVDMTAAMISAARRAAADSGITNVEFRLGEIENLPVADASVDVILSNCVVNLSPDKPRVFREAYRVLKPGGRLAISDVIAIAEIPGGIRDDMEMYSSCISGASTVPEVERMLREAGFEGIRVTPREDSSFMSGWAPGTDIRHFVTSASIAAVRPRV